MEPDSRASPADACVGARTESDGRRSIRWIRASAGLWRRSLPPPAGLPAPPVPGSERPPVFENGASRTGRAGRVTKGATNPNGALKVKVHQGAAIEAMASQRISGLALWAVIEAVSIHVDDFFAVALDCAAERMYNLHGSLSGSVVTPWFGLNGGPGDARQEQSAGPSAPRHPTSKSTNRHCWDNEQSKCMLA